VIKLALAVLACIVAGLIIVHAVVKSFHVLMCRAAKIRGSLPTSLKYLFLFDFVWMKENIIYYESRDMRLTVNVNNLIEIKYHYRFVTGIIGYLEFVQRGGAGFSIDQSIPGMNKVISELEHYLPGFKRSSMVQCIEEGDLGDTCTIWKAPELLQNIKKSQQ